MTGIALGCMWLSYVLGAVFGPDMVTGVQHENFKSAAAIGWISAIAAVILTWILCRFVKTASFEPTAAPVTTAPTVDLEPAVEDATVKLRQLAQLRDSGVITEAEFQAAGHHHRGRAR